MEYLQEYLYGDSILEIPAYPQPCPPACAARGLLKAVNRSVAQGFTSALCIAFVRSGG